MNKNLLKKLAAGATTVAMLGSLGTVAFAAPSVVVDDTEGGNNVLKIDDVTAEYTVSGAAGSEVYTYEINISYSNVAEGDEVTVMSYLFNQQPTDDYIYAVDQTTATGKSGTIPLTLSSDNGIRSATHIDNPTTTENEATELVVLMGTDNSENTAESTAATVRIDLAKATLKETPAASLNVTSVPSVSKSVSYGADLDALKAVMPTAVTVSGTRDGGTTTETEEVNVTWDYTAYSAADWKVNSLTDLVITGTLDPTDATTKNVKLGTNTTVTANVTVNPLTTADVVAPAAIEVAKDGGAAAVAAKVGKVTVKSGDITDTYTIDAADVTVDTTAEGTVDATIVIEGESDNKIFNLTDKSTTVSVTVTEKPAVKYGDVNNDKDVNMKDVVLALQYYMEKTTLTDNQILAANVNGEEGVNMKDVVLILQRYMEKIDQFPVEK